MPSFNRVTLIGNLTRDPQMKYLPTQTPVCEFGLAMSRRYRTAAGEDREETCFVDCTAFGKQAEVIGEYCRKGRPLFVEGRLHFDQWEDKAGQGHPADRSAGPRKRSKLTVTVEHFQFLGSRDGEGGGRPDHPFGPSTSGRTGNLYESRGREPSRDESSDHEPPDDADPRPAREKAAAGAGNSQLRGRRGGNDSSDRGNSNDRRGGAKAKLKDADIPF